MTKDNDENDEGEHQVAIAWAEAGRIFTQSLAQLAICSHSPDATDEEKERFNGVARSLAMRAATELAPLRYELKTEEPHVVH